MADFTLDFGSDGIFTGLGSEYSGDFFALYPPEAGCIGFAVSGDLPTSVVAKVTTRARELMARAVTDGTSLKVTHFAVGVGGYDPANPLAALIVDPNSIALSGEVFRDIIDVYETATADGTAQSFVGRIARDELRAGLGEVGLIATIQNSPFPLENGTTFLFALAHQPLNVKTDRHVVTYRIVIAF